MNRNPNATLFVVNYLVSCEDGVFENWRAPVRCGATSTVVIRNRRCNLQLRLQLGARSVAVFTLPYNYDTCSSPGSARTRPGWPLPCLELVARVIAGVLHVASTGSIGCYYSFAIILLLNLLLVETKGKKTNTTSRTLQHWNFGIKAL